MPAHSRSLLNTDDLAQEVLCRAIVSLEKFDPRHEGAFQGFLRQIMMNRVRDEVRSARRRPTDELNEDEHLADDPSPMELAIGQEALERYEAALQRLKPQERELIVARCELDFSNEEIAALFDKPTPRQRASLLDAHLRDWQRRWPVADDSLSTSWHPRSLNGRPIDWDHAEESARDEPERATVKALHVVAKMTEVVQTPRQ